MTDRRIVGSIDVRQAGRLILSVPADEGWSLYVDGKKTKIKPFADALIGVHLKEGTHKIELRYTTPGVQIGAAISIAALLLFLFSMWIRYKIRGKYGEKCISIVVPMYNEQESLQILYRELNRVTREMGDYDFEYLFVNDGSKDATLQKIRELAAEDERVHYLSFPAILEKKRRCWQDCPMQRGIM